MRIEFIVFGVSMLTVPAIALTGHPPAGAGPWVLIAPPWHDEARILKAADARPIGPIQAPLGLLVASDRTDAPAAMKHAGAWFVVDAGRLAQLCGVTNE